MVDATHHRWTLADDTRITLEFRRIRGWIDTLRATLLSHLTRTPDARDLEQPVDSHTWIL